MLPNSYSSRIANAANKPVVITAHGTLEPWALDHSRWKKRIVGRLFQDRDLRSADCIHVNSRKEIEGIRAYGLKCPVAVIPNGIHLADFDDLPPREQFHEAFPETKGKRIALFMARLHVKKGLEHLIQAWAGLQREFEDWHLVIAGPDCGFGAMARQMVEELDLKSSVTFTGYLVGQSKRMALSASEIFLQPSFSEGFSMAVLEALACRLPALITPGCNFAEAIEARAAVEVEPTVASTRQGLRQLLEMADTDRQEMGERGRRLIEAAYTWDKVAEQTLDLYRWLGSGGQKPEAVIDCD